MAQTQIRLATGIYLRSEAARLLHVSPSRLRRWVDGYTHWYERPTSRETRRSGPPISAAELPVIDRAVALSFVELMELRAVRALVDHSTSLQEVRVVAQVAAKYFGTTHPLASKRLHTDGRHAFAALLGDERETPGLVRLSLHRVEQVIAGPVFQPFPAEVDFNATTALAERWWPLGRNVPVVLDPAIAFGAPSVVGTAIRTSTLARMIEEIGPRSTAEAFQLDPAQVEAAWEFEQQLQAA